MQNSFAKKIFAVGSAAAMALTSFASFATVASAAVHAAGTNVSSTDGTVWMITTDGYRRAYTSAGAFLSYGFNSWSQVVPASAEDLTLPVGSFIPPQDGAIITSDRGSDKGTTYLISGGNKYGFTSAAVFTGLGFSFSNGMFGDVSWMGSGAFLINSSSLAHLPGTLVNNNGTVQLVGTSGLLGIPDLATFNSWGYSFGKVVPANAADKSMVQTGVMTARTAGMLSPNWTTNPGTTPTPTGATPIPGNGGGLSVSLSSQTPASANYAAGAAFLPFTAVNFSAAGNPVVVTKVVVTKSGLAADSTINNMYLFNGATMLAQTSSVQLGKITFQNSSGLFTVPANSTMTVWVKGDISSGVSSGLTYAFGIASAADVQSNASSVSGSFPVSGNLFTTATVSSPVLASLTVAQIAVGSSVNAGATGFLSGQWSMTSSNSAVKVQGINFTMIGSVNGSTDVKNLMLKANGVQVGSTVSGLSAGNMVFFDLSGSPLMINTGNTTQLQLYADLPGGVNRNVQFSIQRNYDVQAFDTTYNVGILSTSSFPQTSTQITINAGSATITRDTTSRTANLAPGMTNVKLATFKICAYGEDEKITSSLPFSITPSGGTLRMSNIKLVDDQGYGLGTADTNAYTALTGAYTQTTSATTLTTSGTSGNVQQSSNFNYVIVANTCRLVSIVADINSGTTATSVTAALTSGSSNLQGLTSVSTTSSSAASGNGLTISTSLLTASTNSGFSSPTKLVPNTQSAKVASFAISAGGADGVNVTTVSITAGSTSVAANFQNLKVMVGATQLGQTQTTITNGQAYSFSASSPIMIAAGQSITIDVYMDVLSGAETSVSQSVATLTSITSQLATSGSSITSPGSVTGQTIIVSGNGSVTISQSPSTPVSRQVAMGTTQVVLGVIKLQESTGNEAATLTDLTVTATAVAGTSLNGSASASKSSFLNFIITDGTTTYCSGKPLVGTDGTGTVTYTITCNGVNIPVPQGPSSYLNLYVKADANQFVNGAASNSQWTVGLAGASGATIRGASSQALITPTLTSNAISNTTTVARTTVGFTAVGSITSPISVTVNPTGVPGTSENVAIFAVTANTAGDAIVKTLTIQQGGTAPTGAAVTYSVYDASNGLSNAVGTAALTGSTAAAVTLNQNSASAEAGVRVPAGQTKYLIVQANTSAFNTGGSGSTKSYTLSLTTWVYSDQTTGFGPSGDSSTVPMVTSSGIGRTY
jgi:hypothetical protein